MRHNIEEAYEAYKESLNKRNKNAVPMTMEQFDIQLKKEKEKYKKAGKKPHSNIRLAASIATQTTKKFTEYKPQPMRDTTNKGIRKVNKNKKISDKSEFVRDWVNKNEEELARRWNKIQEGQTDSRKQFLWSETQKELTINRILSKLSTPTGEFKYKDIEGWNRAAMGELQSKSFADKDLRQEKENLFILNLRSLNGTYAWMDASNILGRRVKPEDIHYIEKNVYRIGDTDYYIVKPDSPDPSQEEDQYEIQMR